MFTAEDERDLGVCLVDIGGGTTKLALCEDGHRAHLLADSDHVLPAVSVVV